MGYSLCRKGEIVLEQKKIDELRECLELLQAIETIEYHDKHWLLLWAAKTPDDLTRENEICLLVHC